MGQDAFPHGATNNSHLLSVAVAKATLDFFASQDVLGNVRSRSGQLRAWLERLTESGLVEGFRLRGLMGCIVCKPRENSVVNAAGKVALYASSYSDMLND